MLSLHIAARYWAAVHSAALRTHVSSRVHPSMVREAVKVPLLQGTGDMRMWREGGSSAAMGNHVNTNSTTTCDVNTANYYVM